jgi:hypothetical protein
MATPEKLSIKFVEELPAKKGGFGGGHAKDLSPIVKMLQGRPGVWALIAENEKSEGALQRLRDFDCEVSTQQATPRKYTAKDGSEKATFTINIYARYVKGFTAKRAAETAKAKAEKAKK